MAQDEETRLTNIEKDSFCYNAPSWIHRIHPGAYVVFLGEALTKDPTILKSLTLTALIDFTGLMAVYMLNSDREAIRHSEEKLHSVEISKHVSKPRPNMTSGS